MENLLTEYIKKQESSKWLHSNQNDYESSSNIINNSVDSSSIRNGLQ